VSAGSPDGELVDVTLSATARPPFVPWVSPAIDMGPV